ncbi:hypothetical protein Tco_1082199 [Tanacetum coccineum]|uniref:Uncharacterized protein n=1 Tax=Tanacetum coccineum TaxID=301880 RepID=A0ABQ5HZT1_9ASTR
MLEFFSTCRIRDEMGLNVAGSEKLVPDKGDLSDYWVEISFGMDFLRGAPSYTYIRDPVRRLYHRLISYSISGRGRHLKKMIATDLFYLCSIDRGVANVPYLLAQYLSKHAEGRKSGARLSRGHLIGRLAHHFVLVSDDGLRGLLIMSRELPLIDMGELVKLNICTEIGDDWAWVALGPKRQQVATAGAPRAAEDVSIVDEGVQADPTPVQAPPQPPPPPPPAVGRTMPQRLGILEEEVQGLRRDVRSLRGLVERLMTDQGIWYDEDIHDLRSVENKFPAIVFNDSLTSNETLSCEPTVSSLNDEIDFRISFDNSDDEDYTVVFDKNSFSYKIISTNDLKTDSENNNEKVNMPLFLSPEPTVSCIDDLIFFKDFENEFPAIVYNDALTSKSDFSSEPNLCSQHIDEFDLKDETSLSEYDEEEQNVLYFNDLFFFNVIYPDNYKIDMIQSSGGNENTRKLLEESHDKIRKVFIMRSFVMELNVNIVAWNHIVNEMLFNLIKNLYVLFGIPFDPKRYYKDGDCARMLRRPRVKRLEAIFDRQVNRVHILDFEGLTLDMRQDLAERMRMVYTGDDGQEDRGQDEAPEKVIVADLFYPRSMDRGVANVPYLLAQYLFRHAEGRKSVVAYELPLINMGELVKLNICIKIGDDWAWVALGPERQQVAVAGAPGAAEDVPAVDEGVQADPTPMQAPQQPPPPSPLAVDRTMP